jgi:hypothetical protein
MTELGWWGRLDPVGLRQGWARATVELGKTTAGLGGGHN